MIGPRVIALLLTLAAALPGVAQAQAVLTPEALRAAAVAAFDSGAVNDARLFAEALLQRDPADVVARAILARLAFAADDPAAARAQAAALWRAAEDPRQRYDAARLAALAAAEEGRFTLSQFWLRRALTVAPDEEAARRTIADYRTIRDRNPWSPELSFTLAPSDNVNGGAETAYNIIEGFPVVGLLSPDAQALSGWIGSADLSTRYRLLATDTGLFEATARLWGRRVWLSDEARAFIAEEQDEGDPPITDSDFSSAMAEVGLSWRRINDSGLLGADLTFGRTWTAGAADYDYLRLGVNAALPRGEDGVVQLRGFAEQRWTPEGANADERLGLQAGYRWQLAGGATLGATLSWNTTLSDSGNRASETRSLTVNWEPAAPFGPVEPMLTIGGHWTEYPDYTVFFPVPGGRQDDGLFARIEMRLPNLSQAGFSPVVTLGYERIDSNVSRFARDGFSIDFGLRSDF